MCFVSPGAISERCTIAESPGVIFDLDKKRGARIQLDSMRFTILCSVVNTTSRHENHCLPHFGPYLWHFGSLDDPICASC